MEDTIKKLSEALQDKELRYTWISNIAMSYHDAEKRYKKENKKVGKYLNGFDKHVIANEAAEIFINRLTSK